jgi:sulfite reductase alpha subunit-like flavoprotein
MIQIDICVLVERSITPYKRTHIGTCSSYIASLVEGDTVIVWIKKGSFPSIATMQSSHLLMIGPGTGVAPMRSYMQERYYNSTKLLQEISSEESGIVASNIMDIDKPLSSNKTVLLFGCRSQTDDFYYENDWNIITKNNILFPSLLLSDTSVAEKGDSSVFTDEFDVAVSFSRSGCNSPSRVTNTIITYGKEIWDLIKNDNVFILVAGSSKSKMPIDVKKALSTIISMHGQMSPVLADQIIQKLERSRKYMVESW